MKRTRLKMNIQHLFSINVLFNTIIKQYAHKTIHTMGYFILTSSQVKVFIYWQTSKST